MSNKSDIVPATRFEAAAIENLRLPPLPRTVVEVSKLLSSGSGAPDTTRLTQIVNFDPLVATTVLRRINSAYYGLRQHVGDIRVAVFLLGFLEVCNIVMTESMLKLKDIFRTQEQVRVFEQIIRISIGAAVFSDAIAAFLGHRHASKAFTAGLLHNTGRLVLLYNRAEDYEALWLTSERLSGPSVDSERIIFGTDHVELGTKASKLWNLPEEIVSLIGSYSSPEILSASPLYQISLTVSSSIYASEYVCSSMDNNVQFQVPEVLDRLARSAQVPVGDLKNHILSKYDTVKSLISEVTSHIPLEED